MVIASIQGINRRGIPQMRIRVEQRRVTQSFYLYNVLVEFSRSYELKFLSIIEIVYYPAYTIFQRSDIKVEEQTNREI